MQVSPVSGAPTIRTDVIGPMMRRNLSSYLLCLIAVALSLQVTAVSAEPDSGSVARVGERPRIGLVLGGGGARGAAHVGVLRELERLRVPIDAIAGTSMGAVVGGLYATGMSANELEDLMVTLDWAEMLSDTPRRQHLTFRRKEDDEQFPLDIGVGIRDGKLLLPKGLVQGQKLDLILRELTIDVSHITNFDDLAIPFRAIASDIERGEAYIMGQGDLALAIRASMSVPGVFAPVRVDGRLLVDGGITGNLPIDVMQQMGVDVIIAVDVEFPLFSPEELDSALTISEQVLTILIRKETLRQIDRLGTQDLLIRPELGTFASTNFGDIAQAIEPGAAAILAIADRIAEISVDEQTYAAHLADRSLTARADQSLAFVRLVHDGRLKSEFLESRLGLELGEPVDTKRLAADANRLFGLKLYEQVSYKLVEENGETGVEFRARATSWGPNYLQFGVSLEDDIEGSTAFNLAARLTRTGINQLGAEWRTDLQLGTDPMLFSEFYQPLGARSRWFLAPRAELRQSNLNAFVMGDAVARLRISEAETGLDLGMEIGTSAEFRVGAFTGTGEASVKVGDPGLPHIDFDTGGVIARFGFDSFDNAWFPRHGVQADVNWTLSRPGFGADTSFETLESDFAAVWSRGKNSLQLGLAYATSNAADTAIQNFFPLGGLLRLSGLERGEIGGPHAGLARLVYYRRVGNSAGGVLETPVYIGVSAEAGNVWQSRSEISFDSLRMNGSVFAGLDTLFGPVYLAAGFAEGGAGNVYLFIGTQPR